MATVKETNITDVRMNVTRSDALEPVLTIQMTGQTRDNDMNPLYFVHEDVTDVLTPEELQALEGLLNRGIAQLMLNHNITAEDIQEGLANRPPGWGEPPPPPVGGAITDPQAGTQAVVGAQVIKDPEDYTIEETQAYTAQMAQQAQAEGDATIAAAEQAIEEISPEQALVMQQAAAYDEAVRIAQQEAQKLAAADAAAAEAARLDAPEPEPMIAPAPTVEEPVTETTETGGANAEAPS